MINISKKIKVSEFFSVCLQLQLEACKIIENIQKQKLQNTQLKGLDDPVTLADIKAQQLIVNGIRQFWPNLKIVGEEDQIYQGEFEFDFKDLNPLLIPEQLFQLDRNEYNINNEFDEENSIFWIDPLDGTNSYVKNEFDAVTCLMGLSHNQKPLLGVIGQPYQKDEITQEYLFNPQIYFSHSLQNDIYIAQFEQLELKFQKYEKQVAKSQEKLVCVTSKYHMTPENLQTINSMDVIIKQNGGSGRKILNIIKGEADFLLYIGSGVKRWDTAAGEALLASFGGVLTGLNGVAYDYNENDLINKNGILATLDRNLHQKLIEKTVNFQ